MVYTGFVILETAPAAASITSSHADCSPQTLVTTKGSRTQAHPLHWVPIQDPRDFWKCPDLKYPKLWYPQVTSYQFSSSVWDMVAGVTDSLQSLNIQFSQSIFLMAFNNQSVCMGERDKARLLKQPLQCCYHSLFNSSLFPTSGLPVFFETVPPLGICLASVVGWGLSTLVLLGCPPCLNVGPVNPIRQTQIQFWGVSQEWVAPIQAISTAQPKLKLLASL